MKKRVVITGMGAVTSLGHSVSQLWEAVKRGECGIDRITHFDTTEYACRIAAEVKDFDARAVIGKEARKMDPFSQFAVASAIEAMRDAGLADGGVDPERLGVVIGNGIGGFETLEDSFRTLFEKGPSRVAPLTIPKIIGNIAPGNIAMYFNAQGPCYTITTACSSGTDAIGEGLRLIREDEADVVIVGGTEAAITPLGIAGFIVIQALSTKYNDSPKKASRPFDKHRDGFVMGEGAGVLILESLEHAKARGARIHAELAGYGMTCDAYHLTAPHPEGRGAVKAIQRALGDAGLSPEDIDYVNAHGTSTPLNDPIETRAIKQAFGEHAYKLKVSSTKSMTGHCIGAAGAIEAILSTMAIVDQFFPPTINQEEPDPECDLDYVPNEGKKGRIRAAISETFGFGGHNGVVVIKEYRE
ncbi:3-oxoacyl-(acyl-carrier-protein) synthase 2 [Spirochaeta thermophila DSM 6578]|uniref:3-oxoacyl-[acyl-carrier-protein] synthase 2 n=1 Tax=Winmispira thermophila (strain ATCC 700085 / DSM 6578 / Z-1203) TaxID=869211 RepID=G0GFQ2_WINT7|nr:beta-ketoacyl-ACP synthase II [Spirochaeta thermophila]AEJ62451.1 3-oxoacyl-(acyl-carrier-protein) synthase 2 [Spirochaeta thermophila DSM 6578]